MTVDEILVQAEAAGAQFRLEGEEVRISYPDDECRDGLSGQIALLRNHRDEVRAFLKARNPWTPYVMPRGVRLVSWEPKVAPVAIDVCSVVVDVTKFIESELRELDSRLNNPWTIHGGFTVPHILERLRQAGVTVDLDPKGGAR
jgi:hypothetical protein